MLISSLNFTYKALQIIGLYRFKIHINKKNVKSFINVTFPLWLLTSSYMYTDFNFGSIFSRQYFTGQILEEAKDFISYLISFFCSVSAYSILSYKKQNIQRLIYLIRSLSRKRDSNVLFILLNILQVLNVALFFLRPLIILYETMQTNTIRNYFILLKDHMFQVTVNYAIVFYEIHFSVYITLIYASFCSMCGILLKVVHRKLKYLDVDQDKDRIAVIFRFYRNIINVTMLTEDVFSGSVLFLMIALFVNSFIFMNYLLGLDPRELMFGYYAISFIMNIISITALIAFASEVPRTIDKIKRSFCSLDEILVLRKNDKNFNKLKMLTDAFLRRETFAFSALKMVYFERSLIFATYGTLISYGLLIVNFQ